MRSPEEVLDIVVAERSGVPVLVQHIAALTIGAVPRQGVVGQDDDPDITTGIVLMRRGENPADVLDAVKKKVELLNRSVLPKGVSIVPYYDRTWLIDKTLKTVFTNLVEGAMLVTLVLLLFLGNFRAAAIVAFDHSAVSARYVSRTDVARHSGKPAFARRNGFRDHRRRRGDRGRKRVPKTLGERKHATDDKRRARADNPRRGRAKWDGPRFSRC